ILAMTDLAKPPASAEEIHARLGGRAAIHEVRAALERLKDLGLIEEREGSLRATCERVTTRADVSNRGAREYHKEVSMLASQALETQGVEEREFQSFALSLPASKLPLAKEMMRKFRTQFCEAMGQEPGDAVYQAN